MYRFNRWVCYYGHTDRIKRYIFLLTVVFTVCLAVNAFAQNDQITQEQKNKLKQIAQDYMQKSGKLRMASHTARMQMNKEYESYKINTANVDKAIADLSKAQRGLLLLHLRNQTDIRQVLSEQQFMAIMKKFPHPKPMRFPAFGMKEFLNKHLLDMLELSTHQQKRLNELWEMDNKAKDLTNNIGESTAKLMELYWNYNLDTKAAKKLINNIHKNQRNLNRISHNNVVLLHKILTPEQFDKLSPWLPSEKNWKKYWDTYKKGAPKHSFGHPPGGFQNPGGWQF